MAQRSFRPPVSLICGYIPASAEVSLEALAVGALLVRVGVLLTLIANDAIQPFAMRPAAMREGASQDDSLDDDALAVGKAVI